MESKHLMFDATFGYSIPDAIRNGLWNYLTYGISGGGFLDRVLVNDFLGASTRADHTWNGRAFADLARWLMHRAPPQSFGTNEKYQSWIGLTDMERRDVMIEYKLRPNEFDILSGRKIS